jgi:SAM-dependent methyltransferase
MHRLRNAGRRALNVARRGLAGLALRPENVSPEIRNDLFQAHLSIYRFFVSFSSGRRVLDLGCGTGYGADHLAAAGAEEIVGVDRDRRSIRYARRRYSRPGVSFQVADIARLPATLGDFDAILASNVFEHLDNPEEGLRAVVDHLAMDGTFLMVVPPIVDKASLEENLRNRFHRSNLFVGEWLSLLRAHFASVRTFRHLLATEAHLDFSDPFPSRCSEDDFVFVEISPNELGTLSSLGAVFVSRGAGACGSRG